MAVTRGPDHIFEMANPAYMRLVHRKEVVGRRVADVFPELQGQGYFDWLDQVYRTGEPFVAREVPISIEADNGLEHAILNFVYQPLRGSDGSVVGIHVHGIDVTEHVRATEALKEKEARFRAVLENALDAAYRRNVQTDRYDYMSPVFEQITGFSPEEMEAMGTEEVLGRMHADDLPQVERAMERAARTGSGTIEYRFRCKDGVYRWLADHFTYHRDEQGELLFRGGIVRDVSDRKRDEEALRRQEHELREMNRTLERRVAERTEDLEERNRELQQFAYVASHDLREPLRKIRSFGDLLMHEVGDVLSSDARFFVERMQLGASRMDQLLSDLLAFSRVSTHSLPFAPVHLARVAADALADYDLKIRETGADFEVDADVLIDADASQVRQLFAHLIDNALKFRRKDLSPRVSIQATIEDIGCRIRVEDNGIGFDERYLDRIFEPFQRLHGRNEYEGSGIGLAVCRRIARRHGGAITAESTPGQGSRFIVDLPVRQPEVQSDGFSGAVEMHPAPATAARGAG